MRQISEERRHALGSLLKRLEEFAAARLELLRQLEKLDVQAKAVQQRHNAIHNADATTSDLPDEILAMIFEEGIHLKEHSSHYFPLHHFGVLVSHVSHRWREVALANSRLWTSIRLIRGEPESEASSCATIEEDGPRPKGFAVNAMSERAAVFLSRAMLSPVNIEIYDFREIDFSTALLQLVKGHTGHCRQLRIVDSDHEGLMKMLECISSQQMPVLSFIRLNSSNQGVAFRQPLFPFGAPRLETAQLDCPQLLTMHLCLPAFGSLTALRLTRISIEGGADEYNALRDGLMALPSLNHFEIELREFWLSESHLPIVLPTIKFLHLDVNYCVDRLHEFIGSIRVPSLATLSLEVGVRPYGDNPNLRNDSLEHFPPLQHLIITNLTSALPRYGPLACKFSGIERLTYISTSGHFYHDPADELRVVDGMFRWPNMRTMAVSMPDGDFDLSWPFWQSTILRSQDAGHPIRKLMLPRTLISKGAHNVTKLREFVEIEAFHVDWPDPFQREAH